MHSAIVILMAVSGLGCQNPSSDATNLPTPLSPVVSSAANPFPSNAIPPPYPGYYPVGDPDLPDTSQQGILGRTFCSFFLGRDPDVRTPSEIEASVFGYGSGQQVPR